MKAPEHKAPVARPPEHAQQKPPQKKPPAAKATKVPEAHTDAKQSKSGTTPQCDDTNDGTRNDDRKRVPFIFIPQEAPPLQRNSTSSP